ncbi:MAG: hypothetical protein HKN21_01250, partial [Candidatus Eisenbacteria bacterium]|nr:hypothetical protein [Candidatus Eisenbacteria bacterium]
MAPISIFSKNFGTKVTALLLALVVYAHVYTEREHERRLRIPLHVRGLSSDLILVKSPPEEVEVQVRGKGKQLLKFQFRPPHVELDLAEARPGEIQRMLSPADVILPLGMDVNVTEVRAPRLVSFQIDTLATKSVPVVINQLGELPERLGWIEPLQSDPPTALI